jgi:hypothetical protein
MGRFQKIESEGRDLTLSKKQGVNLVQSYLYCGILMTPLKKPGED